MAGKSRHPKSERQHMSAINKVMVVGGGGQMGNGIGQVAATAGLHVTLVDLSQSELDRGLKRIERSLERMVRSGSITDAEAEASRERVSTSTDLEATARETDHAVETVVEDIGV